MRHFGSSNWVLGSVVILLGILVLPGLTHAQTAAVIGTVQDASGAVLVGATVKATNTATNGERSTQTGDTGLYRISNLAPAVYVISVEKSGFQAVRFENITLTVDQIRTLDAKLEVGTVTEQLEVTGESVAAVDTETPMLSSVVDQQHITELPLILRDPYQLILLGAGVTQGDDFGGVSVNGARTRNNNFLLDGVDNNDAEVPGGLGGVTSQNPDSTQEFRVITNNFAPEFGRNNGAIVDVITRSGTNDYHGNLFWFGRYDALGARDFFNHQTDPVTGKVAAKDPYVRNIYGGSVGGPIKKDSTFFFLNYEGHRFVTALTNQSIVPTAGLKKGMFTYTNPACTTPPCSAPIDVSTANSPNNGSTLVLGTPISLDPLMQKILALYPLPNVVNANGVTGLLFFPSTSREKDEDATLKIDHKLTQNNQLAFRYLYNWFSDPNATHSDFLPGNIGAENEFARTQAASASLTSTIKATLINEFRLGANRIHFFGACSGASLFDSFGFVDPFGRGADYGLPFISGFGCPGALGASDGQARFAGTYQAWDNMSWVVRQHTLKWGAELRHAYANSFTDFGSRQAFSFNTNFQFGLPTVTNVPNSVNSLELNDLVSMLQGLLVQQIQTQYFPNPTTRTASDNLSFRQHELGVFWQDEWKIRSNFTLTYGLRWEFYGVPYETHREVSTLFTDPSGSGPFTFTAVGNKSPRLYANDYGDFQPRVGFAWDPFKNGRTSVRGGIGVFNDRVYGNLISDIRGNPPFQPTALCQPLTGTATVPNCAFLTNPVAFQLFQQVTLGATSASPTVPNGAGIFPDLFDPHLKPPRSINWNVGIQRELVRGLTMEANYVGTHATRILRVVDGNPPQPDLVSALEAFCVPGNPANTGFNTLANPVLGTQAGQCSQATLQFSNLYFGFQGAGSPFNLVPHNAINNNAFAHTFTDKTTGRGFYDGLQIQVSERGFHGLQIAGSYTWSHAIDDSSDPLVTTLGNGNYPIDSFALFREKGNSGFDTRHRAVINFIYQPNFGKGRGHLNSGFVGRAFEGWELSGIAAFQTGLPYDIFGFADTLHTGLSDRATIIGSLHNPPGTDEAHTGPPASAFNPDDPNNKVTPIPFGIPANIGRNAFYGPGINNWNMSLAKTTAITERVGLQLRFEFYNLFNRVQFAKPDNNLADSSTFGQSLSQVGQNDGTTGARQIQVGAKLNF